MASLSRCYRSPKILIRGMKNIQEITCFGFPTNIFVALVSSCWVLYEIHLRVATWISCNFFSKRCGPMMQTDYFKLKSLPTIVEFVFYYNRLPSIYNFKLTICFIVVVHASQFISLRFYYFRLGKLIHKAPIMLFMKGDPSVPGFCLYLVNISYEIEVSRKKLYCLN